MSKDPRDDEPIGDPQLWPWTIKIRIGNEFDVHPHKLIHMAKPDDVQAPNAALRLILLLKEFAKIVPASVPPDEWHEASRDFWPVQATDSRDYTLHDIHAAHWHCDDEHGSRPWEDSLHAWWAHEYRGAIDKLCFEHKDEWRSTPGMEEFQAFPSATTARKLQWAMTTKSRTSKPATSAESESALSPPKKSRTTAKAVSAH
jgi:hypothetical protein